MQKELIQKEEQIIKTKPGQPEHILPTKEELLLNYVIENAEEGNPQSVLDCIDKFACEQKWLMNLGPDKGKIVTQRISEKQPKVMVELGGYVGYSAVLFGSKIPEGGKVYSIEIKPLFAAIATKIIEFAGLQSKVKVLIGTAETKIEYLKNQIQSIDILFIDHWKELYVEDFQRFEKSGLLKVGSYVIGDNIVFPGSPEYRAMMEKHPDYESTLVEEYLEYSKEIMDAVLISKKIK